MEVLTSIKGVMVHEKTTVISMKLTGIRCPNLHGFEERGFLKEITMEPIYRICLLSTMAIHFGRENWGNLSLLGFGA